MNTTPAGEVIEATHVRIPTPDLDAAAWQLHVLIVDGEMDAFWCSPSGACVLVEIGHA
ncbi:MAG TPA: hypothetical protein VIV60_20720 [Polyangiaceae bacterium]